MTVQKLLNLSFPVVAWVVVELLVLLQMSPLAASQNGTGLQGQQSQGSLDSLDGLELNKRIARMVIIVSVIFFLRFFCVYVCQCTNSIIHGRFDLATTNVDRNALRSHFASGIGTDTIKTFPTFLYSTVKGLKMGKGLLECCSARIWPSSRSEGDGDDETQNFLCSVFLVDETFPPSERFHQERRLPFLFLNKSMTWQPMPQRVHTSVACSTAD